MRPNKKLIKIAVAGALIAVAMDYFIKPSISKTLKV